MKKIKEILLDNIYTISLYGRQISGTLVILFLARYLSVYDYGLFSSYKSIASFLLLFTNLGYNEYILVSSKNNIREIKLKIGLFIINAIFCLVLLSFFSLFTPIESKILFVLVLLRTFFDYTFFGLVLSYFQASRKFIIISGVNLFYSFCIIIITLISYFLKLSLLKFLLLNIVLGIINFVQVSYYANINYFLVITNVKRLIKNLDKSIFAYIGTILGGYLYTQLPSLYSSTFLSKTDAALYFAAFSIATVISILITAQTQKIIPEMINADKAKNIQLINFNLKFLVFVNILILLFFIFIGKFLLHLLYMKDYYQNAYPVLIILTFANILLSIASVHGAYITASNRQYIKFKMQVQSILIGVLVLFIFNKFKIYSPALAYLFSNLYIAITFSMAARKYLIEDNF